MSHAKYDTEDTDLKFNQMYWAKLAQMEPAEKMQRMFTLSSMAASSC